MKKKQIYNFTITGELTDVQCSFLQSLITNAVDTLTKDGSNVKWEMIEVEDKNELG